MSLVSLVARSGGGKYSWYSLTGSGLGFGQWACVAETQRIHLKGVYQRELSGIWCLFDYLMDLRSFYNWKHMKILMEQRYS